MDLESKREVLTKINEGISREKINLNAFAAEYFDF